jgi:tripartite-type tricarboxylate transporter receptor subunit TctC
MTKFFTLLAIALGLIASNPASAQAWEATRPVQIIIPYPPGGGPDVVLGILIPELSKRLGQSVIMMHRPGGNTVIGTQAIARAMPDGHTIGIATDQLVINPLLMNSLPYKPDDLIPLTQLVEGFFVLAAGTGKTFNSLPSLIAAAKASPDKFTYAIPGNGSPHHLMMEGMSQAAGIKLKAVPYQGSSQMITDLMGGHVDMLLLGAVTAVENVKNGKMIALAAMSPTRLPQAPTISTVSESGVPGFSQSFWYGLIAPKGTPLAAMARLNREITTLLNTPEIKERIAAVNFFPRPTTPEEFGATIRRDAAKYEKVIQQSRIRLE